MAYRDFSLDDVTELLGIRPEVRTIFPPLVPETAPRWLTDVLTRTQRLASVSEKARSVWYVAPVLLAARDLCDDSFAIYSGQRFNVEPQRGLVGVCDFILARMPIGVRPRAPVLMIAEAKRGIIEQGMGQCIAEMVAARTYNARDGKSDSPVYGCVTSGIEWQFLRLDGDVAVYQTPPLLLTQLGELLAALKHLLTPPATNPAG